MAYDLMRMLPEHRAIVVRIRELFPDETDDDLADTIAGESSLPDAIVAVLRNAIEREATGRALGELIDAMTARRRRLDEGARTLRAAALQAIQEAGLRKLSAPDFTVSVGRGKPKVLIVDLDKIPNNLCKIVREPSKSLIATELTAGRDVPGACLGNAQSFIAIHRS